MTETKDSLQDLSVEIEISDADENRSQTADAVLIRNGPFLPRNPGSHAGISLIGNQLVKLLIEILEVDHFAAELLIDAGMCDVVFVETFYPIDQCFIRWDAQARLEDFIGPSDCFRDPGEVEEGDVRAGTPAVIGEE